MKKTLFLLCCLAALQASAQKRISIAQIKGKVFEMTQIVKGDKRNVVIYDKNNTAILVDDDGVEVTFSPSGSPSFVLSALYLNYFVRAVYDDIRDGATQRIYLMEHR